MSQKETDLRVRRTHLILKQAFLDLCEKKGFRAITVGDITEHAMVNRVTFYRHYKDKYELVRDIFDEAIEDLDKEMGPPTIRINRWRRCLHSRSFTFSSTLRPTPDSIQP